jgi:hypothetical protein
LDLVENGKSLIEEKEQLASTISRSMEDIQDLKDQLRTKDRELSQAKDDIVRAQRISPEPMVQKSLPKEPVISKSAVEEAIEWSKTHTTLVFPMLVTVKDKPVTLQDAKQMVKIPVQVGKMVRAKGYHPQSADFLVVAQEKSDKFLATIRIENSNFVDLLMPKFQNRASTIDRGPVNPLLVAPKRSTTTPASSSRAPVSNPSVSSNRSASSLATPAKASVSATPTVVKGKAINAQKPEDMLGSMDSSTQAKKVDTSDHGANCVCKDCRAKKIGKGSLFPDP